MEQFYTKITSCNIMERYKHGKISNRGFMEEFSFATFYHTEGVKRDNSLNNIRRSVEFHVGKFF